MNFNGLGGEVDNFQVIIYILVVLLGLAVGSLLNVIISRFDDLQSKPSVNKEAYEN